MLTQQKMEELIGTVLLIGIALSLVLVCIGGAFYLWQYGGQPLHTELLQDDVFKASPIHILQLALSLTPLGIIELGLLILVATQIMRVALLLFFYIRLRDYWFILISVFILMILLYSFLWHE